MKIRNKFYVEHIQYHNFKRIKYSYGSRQSTFFGLNIIHIFEGITMENIRNEPNSIQLETSETQKQNRNPIHHMHSGVRTPTWIYIMS